MKAQQSTIGGGGRYDGLIELLGGRPTPGVGFATGIERIILNLKRQGLPVHGQRNPDVYVAVQTPAARVPAFRLASELRRAGITALVGTGERSLKAQTASCRRPRCILRRDSRRARAGSTARSP